MLNEKPILIVKEGKEEAEKYFPRYVLEPTSLNPGALNKAVIWMITSFIKLIIWTLLNPRKTKVGNLGKKEVSDVYKREAKTYNWKHHLTTRGIDLMWRRWAGWMIAPVCEKFRQVKILDLCTGTGLTVKEMRPILKKYGVKAEIIGLDYEPAMLSVAVSLAEPSDKNILTFFTQGDATDLKFKANSFDFITQICGIGGIDKPVEEFYCVLKALKPGGRFIMADIHRPIPEFSGEWPFLLKWLKMPALEASVHEQVTVPLALKRLWAWRDPTPTFYLLPLVTIEDNGFWGFKIKFFEAAPERWWFGLPIMGIAKIVVKKTSISKETHDARKKILESCEIPE